MIIIQSFKARTDIVFDVYKDNSIKTAELEGRGEATGTCTVFCQICGNMYIRCVTKNILIILTLAKLGGLLVKRLV